MPDDKMPPVAVTQTKDIRIVEFQNNKILDEGNIADIGVTLNAMIEESQPYRHRTEDLVPPNPSGRLNPV